MQREAENQRAPGLVRLAGRPLLVLAAVLACGIATRNCWPLAELRYLETCREMLVLDDFVIPHLKDLVYLHKLPFVFWQVVALSELGGLSLDLAARLVPALWALVLVVACTKLALGLTQDRRIAERAGMLAALSPGTLYLGQVFLFDMPLAALVASTLAVAQAGLAKGRPIPHLAWLCVGLALFTKGPVALLVSLPPLALLVVARRDRAGLRPGRRQIVAAPLCIAPALVWVFLVYLRIPWPEFVELVWGQTSGRFSGRLGHSQAFWYYAPTVVLYTLPALLLVQRARGAPRPLRWFAFCAVGLVVVFSMIRTKAPHYLFPVLPIALPWLAWASLPAGVAQARALVGHATLRLLAAGLLVCAGLLASGALAALVDSERVLRALIAADLDATSKVWALVAIPVLGAACFASSRHLGICARFALVAAAGSLVLLPPINRVQLPRDATLELVARRRLEGKPVALLRGRFHGNFHFLLADSGLVAAERPDELERLTAIPGALVVGYARDAEHVPATAGLGLVTRDTFFGRVLCVWTAE